jgi:hypothetical protein
MVNGKTEPRRRVGTTTTLNKPTNRCQKAAIQPARSAGERTKALSAPAGVSAPPHLKLLKKHNLGPQT